jgi:hypothetical protein
MLPRSVSASTASISEAGTVVVSTPSVTRSLTRVPFGKPATVRAIEPPSADHGICRPQQAAALNDTVLRLNIR